MIILISAWAIWGTHQCNWETQLDSFPAHYVRDPYRIVTYWSEMAIQIWVNLGSGNGLLPDLPCQFCEDNQWYRKFDTHADTLIDWNQKGVTLTIFSPLAALKVVILTTLSAAIMQRSSTGRPSVSVYDDPIKKSWSLMHNWKYSYRRF